MAALRNCWVRCGHIPQFFVVSADTYHQSFPIWALEVTAISVAMV